MLKGFRDFLMRGNVVDLAVAVVIGAAFGGVVKAFSDDVIGSMLAQVKGTEAFADATIGFVKVGSTITALINFVIVAAVVYFLIVVPMNKLNSLRRKPAAEEPAPVPEDIALLTEIRDLLAQRSSQL